MASADPFSAVRARLAEHGQAHLLSPPPPAAAAEDYLRQLRGLDLPWLRRMFESSTSAQPPAGDITPFEDITCVEELPAGGAEARSEGLRLIAEGKVAALLLAGGSGTRLGSAAPKGCYDIGMPSHKSLFQYHAERLLGARRLAAQHSGRRLEEVHLPLLVMTSEANDGETRAFFAERDRFGLPPDQLHFFTQGMLPAFDERGRILRSSASQLALSPNGNGGVYLSLQEAGLLEEMSRRGVTSVFQFGVDNVLCHVADPTFVGFCSLRGADCGVKTIAKADPHEKVGVLASVGGKPHVVEYSEISTEMAEATREALSGSGTRLLYGAAHICVNWFSLPFLRAFAAGALGEEGSASLPLHVARKKVPCLDPDKGGGSVPLQPSEPNAIKLELFIFDTFPHAAKLVALQVPREHEFAPVKNAPGAASDSPDTACAAFSRLCVDRLVAAGGTVKAPRPCVAANSGNGSRPRPLLEISPLVSYAGEGLEERVAGREFELPQHLC